jgi:hypothetical protein
VFDAPYSRVPNHTIAVVTLTKLNRTTRLAPAGRSQLDAQDVTDQADGSVDEEDPSPHVPIDEETAKDRCQRWRAV